MLKSGLLLCLLVGLSTALHISRDAQWEAFKKTYNKVYTERTTKSDRRMIWEANIEFIEKHNAEAARGYHSFTVGENEYADLSPEEWRQLTGLSVNYNLGLHAAAPADGRRDDLPESIDWRQKGFVTPVKDQTTKCGSCWAFSAVGAIEGAIYKKTGKLTSLSEQNLVDCASSTGCHGGFMKTAFQWVVKNGGIDTEASYPYAAAEGQKCHYKSEDSGASITSFVEVARGSEGDLQKAVGLVGPVSVGIDASLKTFHLYKNGVYSEADCSSTKLDHAVVAVGYGKESDKEYWLVKNSWGGSWGDQGYIKMARNQKNHCGIATMASYPIA